MMLNGTGERIDEEQYPMTSEEFVERYGDVELDLPNGTERLGDAIERLDDETYRCPEDARFAIYTAVSNKAIGRPQYSDRDPTPMGAPHAPEQLSL